MFLVQIRNDEHSAPNVSEFVLESPEALSSFLYNADLLLDKGLSVQIVDIRHKDGNRGVYFELVQMNK